MFFHPGRLSNRAQARYGTLCEAVGPYQSKVMILKCPTCKTDCKFSEIRKEKLPEGGYLIRCGKCQCTIGIKDLDGRIKMLNSKEVS